MTGIKKKIEGYKKYWQKTNVERPLIGIEIRDYHQFQRFKALAKLRDKKYLTPDLIKPELYLEDYENFYQQEIKLDDDLIRGFAPVPAIPWMEAILGCSVEISGDSIWAKEKNASLEELKDLSVTDDNKWLTKYLEFLEFLEKLRKNMEKEYPVGLPILRGVGDVFGALRGHSQSLIDFLDEPELTKKAVFNITQAILKVLKKHFEIVKPFLGGYFIEQYFMWAPDKIIRMQNDETGVYSPQIYNNFMQENDRLIATSFPYSLIHLHTSSLFLLDNFLEIEKIDCFEINKELDWTIEDMLPYLKKVQDKNRCLFIRGSMDKGDFQKIKYNLSPNGLCLQPIVTTLKTAKDLLNSFKESYN